MGMQIKQESKRETSMVAGFKANGSRVMVESDGDEEGQDQQSQMGTVADEFDNLEYIDDPNDERTEFDSVSTQNKPQKPAEMEEAK